MKAVYDLANKLQPPQPRPSSEESADPAVVCMRYGWDPHSACEKCALWFKRVHGESKSQDTGSEKHRRVGEEFSLEMGGQEGKRRKIRKGRQSDVGAMLGTFG